MSNYSKYGNLKDVPFSEEVYDNFLIREFNSNVDSDTLVWHRDKQDRLIEVLEDTDWMFQFDNEIPKIMEGEIYIPKNSYHRVIKGSKNLKIKVTFID